MTQYSQVNSNVLFDSGVPEEPRGNTSLDDAFASSDDDESLDDWADDRQVESTRRDGYGRVDAPGASASAPEASSSFAPAAPSAANRTAAVARSWLGAWRQRVTGRRAARSAPSAGDGVFANLTEKPDVNAVSEDHPPTYEEAAADATPPYWETTIMAPGYADEVFVDGLPVGNYFNLVWNMLVSVAFQFVGFFVTYLLHTSHAAKQGSRAGLGLTLIQYGYYLLPEASMSDSPNSPAPDTIFQPEDPNDFDVSDLSSVHGTYIESSSAETFQAAAPDAKTSPKWLAFALMIIGWLVVVRALVDYTRAKQMERAILQSTEQAVVDVGGNDDDDDERDDAEEHTEQPVRVSFA